MKDNTQNRITDAPSALLAALMGALLTGFMWRLRGDHGFGGSTGMYAVLTVLLLFLVWLFPRKDKVNLPFITLASFAGAITAGGWGTINSQITGWMTSTGAFLGEEKAVDIAVSPLAGVITMLLLGFGWLPLFGMMLGQYFSDRKYHILNAVEGTAVFYAASYLFRFTGAPYLYKLINPTAVKLFEDGLASYGIEQTPQSLLLKFFGDQSKKVKYLLDGETLKIKIKEIPGGRNYFTCCAVLAAAFGALALIVYLALRFRDKKAAGITALTCSAMAVSITVPDVFFLIGAWGESGKIAVPQALIENSWSFWEYGTGFLFGLLIVLLLLPFAKQKLKNNVTLFELKGLPKVLKKIVAVLAFACTFCLAPVLAVASRMDEMSEKAVLPATVAAAVIGVGLTVLFTVKNKKTLSPLGKTPAQAARTACPILFAVYALLYFFIGPAYALHQPQSAVTSLMMFSFALFCLGYVLLSALLRKKTK
ncbi:MAG TPA: hypothetical protein DDY98_05975 [Ruminococcaceae bacterium]|nr:hypothetical protein [Oscillospiraceae bacterium]